jgi:hypothetical protein
VTAVALACEVPEVDDGEDPDDVGDTTLDADALADGIEAGIAGPPGPVVAATPIARASVEATPSHDTACRSYCRDYDARCGDAGVFADDSACAEACAAWSPGEADAVGDSVSCRAAFLAPGRTSCIAAGPSSPLCIETSGDVDSVEAV